MMRGRIKEETRRWRGERVMEEEAEMEAVEGARTEKGEWMTQESERRGASLPACTLS